MQCTCLMIGIAADAISCIVFPLACSSCELADGPMTRHLAACCQAYGKQHGQVLKIQPHPSPHVFRCMALLTPPVRLEKESAAETLADRLHSFEESSAKGCRLLSQGRTGSQLALTASATYGATQGAGAPGVHEAHPAQSSGCSCRHCSVARPTRKMCQSPWWRWVTGSPRHPGQDP